MRILGPPPYCLECVLREKCRECQDQHYPKDFWDDEAIEDRLKEVFKCKMFVDKE